MPITRVINETLLSETFIEPSDTGFVCETGAYHIVWDIGNDVPGREFYREKVEIEILAAKPGIIPGDCGCGECIDIDGNSYETIQIGDQCWLSVNLKVTHYCDGTPIPNVTDGGTWSGLITGAYCEYDNDLLNVPTYGRLYNWYAADDPHGLAPVGWHVPTDDDWKTLEIFLGMDSTEANNIGLRGTDQGSKLAGKADLWYDGVKESDPAFCTSGITALPGGERVPGGHFRGMVWYGLFWSSSGCLASNAWTRYIYLDDAGVYRYDEVRQYGFSVRCVRDY